MAFTPVPTLPEPPRRNETQSEFVTKANNFLGALPDWSDSLNNLADEIKDASDSAISAANSSAAAASGHADAAAASALQAGDAKTSAEAARDAAMLSAGTFPSVSAALAETTDGEYFTVVEGQFLRLYLNEAGAAQPQIHYPSAAALQVSEQSLRAEIQARPDPLLTSLLF